MAVAVATCVTTPLSPLSLTMQRPPIGIERLPLKRTSSETKELMNCNSCRRRKIKCSRVRPSCEACQVFQCDCIYDAIPKKRGPKPNSTDVSRKSKGSLRKQLKQDEKALGEPTVQCTEPGGKRQSSSSPDSSNQDPKSWETVSDSEPSQPGRSNTLLSWSSLQDTLPLADRILNTYFDRLHEKPFFILDQRATRQRMRDGMLPRFLTNALFAVTIRLVPSAGDDYSSALKSSREFAEQSRMNTDVDEPTIDHLQSLLLLAMANYQIGNGKKSYMHLSHATAMAVALGLHHELPANLRVSNGERESRRKLFWTCYLMDRFYACGSKRPTFLVDESIKLRLPAWQPNGSPIWLDGDFFTTASSLPESSISSGVSKGSGAALVDIARILGEANSYLAVGGFRSDSFFPWHDHSRLSRIRADLDRWASTTQEAFHSVSELFGHSESTTWVFSKLIYHLIHCLIYRPFLPVNNTELHRTGQNHLWHLEAISSCFLHANAIAELLEIGTSTATDWPPGVAYCIFNAATIHVHGAYYKHPLDGVVFGRSTDYLSHEVDMLYRLANIWLCAQHQLQLLQTVCTRHSQLLGTLDADLASSLFQSGDFYNRYVGLQIDPAYIALTPPTTGRTDAAKGSGGEALGQTSQWMQPILSRGRAQSQPYNLRTVDECQGQRRVTRPDICYSGSISNGQPEGHKVSPTSQRILSNAQDISGLSSCNLHLGEPSNSIYNQSSSASANFRTSPVNSSAAAVSNCFSPLQYDLSLNQQPITSSSLLLEDNADDSFMQDIPEQDSFFALLEQMASNESACAGMSELDYFLAGQDTT
ncbi:hypothetical protein K431DRAFT_327069 [Polychaeton citri CBS 116435]|uniref:Zn(2)-C6 fungal-type domain-containing protein n=1 Tax=Polychaeton citri CBS 116435 TaxID=1314669 RepID=A0A9P4QCJ2_9PEZI|nr:hypothetical protein K431DRAFT_327069 [Polychaeton citri CBS 116435]